MLSFFDYFECTREQKQLYEASNILETLDVSAEEFVCEVFRSLIRNEPDPVERRRLTDIQEGVLSAVGAGARKVWDTVAGWGNQLKQGWQGGANQQQQQQQQGDPIYNQMLQLWHTIQQYGLGPQFSQAIEMLVKTYHTANQQQNGEAPADASAAPPADANAGTGQPQPGGQPPQPGGQPPQPGGQPPQPGGQPPQPGVQPPQPGGQPPQPGVQPPQPGAAKQPRKRKQ